MLTILFLVNHTLDLINNNILKNTVINHHHISLSVDGDKEGDMWIEADTF